MANAVRSVTLEQGLDPRDFTLVAYGGNGPLHGAAVARELQIRKLIIPQAPGHFSAVGMLMADLRRDFVQTLFRRVRELDTDTLEQEFLKLEAEGRAALESSGIATDRIVFERSADMRYVGQEHSVAVRMPGRLEGEGAREQVKQLFDAAHEQRYSHSAPDEQSDLVSIRVSAIGQLSKPPLPEIETGSEEPVAAARKGSRSIIFDRLGALACDVYDREKLLARNVINGPAVIEEAASTTILSPGDTAVVNRFGHLEIDLGA
jgi:N-methylhydantoinase A